MPAIRRFCHWHLARHQLYNNSNNSYTGLRGSYSFLVYGSRLMYGKCYRPMHPSFRCLHVSLWMLHAEANVCGDYKYNASVQIWLVCGGRDDIILHFKFDLKMSNYTPAWYRNSDINADYGNCNYYSYYSLCYFSRNAVLCCLSISNSAVIHRPWSTRNCLPCRSIAYLLSCVMIARLL